MATKKSSSRFLSSTLMVTAIIILSKAVGFGRDIVTTAYFGTSMANDAYNSAYSLFYLPVLLFNSCISATLIPLYVDQRENNSLKEANHFASNAINLFAVASLIISVLMLLLSRPLVSIVYNGFDAEKVAITTDLLRIMLLALVFNVTSISVASLLNAAEKYIAAQLTGFPLSICVIIASVFFSGRYGIHAVAWGVFAANLLQLIVLIPFLRGWFDYTAVLDINDRRFHRLVMLAGPAMLSMGISELNHMIDHALASGLPGGTLTSMTAAYRLVTFLQGILIVPLTTIMFSKMSKRVAENDEKGAVSMMLNSVLTLLMVVLPIVTIGAILSKDVIRFAYMRGKFNEQDVIVTAGILSFYVVGIPAFGLRDFFSRTFHALKDTKTPFKVSCLVVTSNIILNFILRHFMGANGLAFATSIAGYIGTVTLILLLRKRFGTLGLRSILVELGKIVIASACAGCACWLMISRLPVYPGFLHTFGRLVACSVVAVILYVVVCIVLRLKAIKNAVRMLKR